MSRVFVRASDSEATVETAVVSGAPFTISAWVYNTSAIDDDDCVVQIADSSVINNWYRLNFHGGLGGDPVQFISNAGGGLQIAATSTSMTANTWHHLCGREEAIDARSVFLDGGGKGTDAGSAGPSGLDRTTIGRETDSSADDSFDGRIAHVCIWDIALSDAEVIALANGASVFMIRPGSIVGYWPLYGTSSPEVDWSGNGNNLTLTAATVGDGPPLVGPPIIWPGYISSRIIVPSGFVPYPNPRYALEGGMQNMSGGV